MRTSSLLWMSGVWGVPLVVQAEELPRSAEAAVTVQRFKVVGSSVFDEWELSNVTQPYEDRPLTLAGLQKAADAVTRYYLDHGYLTSRAVLVDQTIDQSTVQIQVMEGSLESIEVQGTRRLNPAYVRDRIRRASLKPLNQEQLETQLRMLRSSSVLSNIEASLKEGSRPGHSALTVRVTEAAAPIALLSADNYGSPGVGAAKVNATLGTRNLTGAADVLLVNSARSATGGSTLWSVSYQRLLNAKDGTLSVRVSPNHYRLTQADLRDLGIHGTSSLYDVTLRQPLSRQVNGEVAMSLGLVRRTGQTRVGEFLASETDATIVRFGQDWMQRDRQGLWLARSQFDFGMALLNRTASDREPDNRFMTWSGQLQRFQMLSDHQVLRAELAWQVTPDRLLPPQQFNFGGAQSGRGYPQSLLSGDNGMALMVEHQLTLLRRSASEPLLQLLPFWEMGTIWNHPENPVRESARHLFMSAGVGVIWKPLTQWTLRLDVAVPLSSVADRTDALQTPAVYVNSSYRF